MGGVDLALEERRRAFAKVVEIFRGGGVDISKLQEKTSRVFKNCLFGQNLRKLLQFWQIFVWGVRLPKSHSPFLGRGRAAVQDPILGPLSIHSMYSALHEAVATLGSSLCLSIHRNACFAVVC